MRAKRDIQARLPKRRRGAVEGHREQAGLGPLIAAQAGPRPRGDTDDEMEVEEEEGAPQFARAAGRACAAMGPPSRASNLRR